MPKKMTYSLIWSPDQQRYALYTSSGNTLDIIPESSDWFSWLNQVSSFAFTGRTSRCILRKESRKRGGVYWYAYRSSGKELCKRYVGKTINMSIDHLEAVIALMQGTDSLQEKPLPALQSDASLLVTKLHIPRPRSSLVARVHLQRVLDQGIQRPLTLLSAPAGSGKTTLLAQWIAQHNTPVAWLSLEEADNQPTRFFAYLVAALQQLDAGIGDTSLPPLQTSQPSTLEMALGLLANEIACSTLESLILVIDDYHVITARPIHQAMTFLLDHLPPQFHLITLTRADPPWPLARLRARDQLVELRDRDLRFDSSEISVFLHDVVHVELPSDDIMLLEQRTEGWIVGLQFAALSLRGQTNTSAFLQTFSGSHRFVLDYLSDEILAYQPEPVLTFLLHTCILERLCGALCAAVLGEETIVAEIRCQNMLQMLEDTNLFINSLDDNHHWYRYHQLFADVLQAKLTHTSSDLVPTLHRRASLWFEQHGYIHEAIHHALAAQDVARFLSLLRPIVWDTLLHGEFDVLLDWLQRLPPALEQTQPSLCLYHAAALAFLGQAKAAKTYLQSIEQSSPNTINQTKQKEMQHLAVSSGEIAAIRMVIAVAEGNLAQALIAGQHARTHLQQDQVFLRSLVLGSETFVYAINGDFRAAIESLWEAKNLTLHVDNLFTLHKTMTGFTFFLLHLGQLRRSISTCEEMLSHAIRPTGRPLPYAGTMYITLAIGLYEQNELEAALRAVRQGITLCEQMDDTPSLAIGYALLAQIFYLQQCKIQPQPEISHDVAECMQRAEILLWKQPPVLLWTRNYAAYFLVRLWLVQGDLEAILRLLQFYPIDESVCSIPGCAYATQTEAWALSYMRLAQHMPEQTIALLHWPIQAAEQAGRLHHMLRMLILYSLAYHALGNTMEALKNVLRAVQLGETEGYINAFVEMGQPMGQLLLPLLEQEQAKPATPVPLAYLRRLLHELGIETLPARQSPPTLPSLVEPLTEREAEVLRLLGTGLSNHDIAHHLVIEISTVKWHVRHIYHKLGVQNRAQAILQAQAFDLL